LLKAASKTLKKENLLKNKIFETVSLINTLKKNVDEKIQAKINIRAIKIEDDKIK